MPLTHVIDYFNDYLPALHPRAHLGRQATFRLIDGRVSAQVAGCRLTPWQTPVLVRATGERFGWSARLRVQSAAGQPMLPEGLYVHAWDAEDVIFLDRFLRTLHALHHLSLGEGRSGLLALDVHVRHVAALPEQHGQVFEALLYRLGLMPPQIVLRLAGTALQQDPHVQAAARSFSGRGYGLLAVRPSPAELDWAGLRTLGVRWVTPDPATWLATASPDGWARAARAEGITLWVERAGDPGTRSAAAVLDAELIEVEPAGQDPGLEARVSGGRQLMETS
jgi:hypothetical protein